MRKIKLLGRIASCKQRINGQPLSYARGIKIIAYKMRTKTRTFTSPQFGSVRTAGTPENPLFMAKDLSRALGLAKPFKTSERFEPEDIAYLPVGRKGCKPLFLTIRGMRDALLNSKSSKGDLIYNWISREVIPAITAKPGVAGRKVGRPPKTSPKEVKIPNGVIPFPKPEYAAKGQGTAFTVEDFLKVIFSIDEAVAEAVRLLGGIGSDGNVVERHLENLLDSSARNKDALLDVMKDVLMIGGQAASA